MLHNGSNPSTLRISNPSTSSHRAYTWEMLTCACAPAGNAALHMHAAIFAHLIRCCLRQCLHAHAARLWDVRATWRLSMPSILPWGLARMQVTCGVTLSPACWCRPQHRHSTHSTGMGVCSACYWHASKAGSHCGHEI